MISKTATTTLRSTIFAIVTLTAYSLAISNGWITPHNGNTHAQTKLILSEEYLYSDNDYRVVLVGSSLMWGVHHNSGSSRPSWGNLAVGGSSCQTGLELLTKTNQEGKTLIVEVNDTIIQGIDDEVVDNIFGYGLFPIRKRLPMLQCRYCPAGIANRAFVTTFGKSPVDNPSNLTPDLTYDGSTEWLREKCVARLQAEYEIPWTNESFDKFQVNASLIKISIKKLEDRGWKVFLCHIPRDSLLSNTPREKAFRALVTETFPADHYRWIPEVEHACVTRDGLHLIPRDAYAEAERINDFLHTISSLRMSTK